MSVTPAASGSRPGPEARRERQRQEARRAILDATEELLLASGSDDFSVRELARRSGYSAPTIYSYFGDKDGVIDSLLEERFAGLVDAVRRIELDADPAENARRMALTFLAFGRDNPPFYRLISSFSRKGESRTPPGVEAMRERMEKPMLELARAGRLRIDERTAGQALWALTHGLASLLSARPDHDWAGDLEAAALDALLRGLVQPSGSET